MNISFTFINIIVYVRNLMKSIVYILIFIPNLPGPDIILHQFLLAPLSLALNVDDCFPGIE